MFNALLKVITWVQKSTSYSRVFWLSLYMKNIRQNIHKSLYLSLPLQWLSIYRLVCDILYIFVWLRSAQKYMFFELKFVWKLYRESVVFKVDTLYSVHYTKINSHTERPISNRISIELRAKNTHIILKNLVFFFKNFLKMALYNFLND